MDLNATPKLKQLGIVLNKMSEEERYKKAARHFKDAKYLRGVRHDIDGIYLENRFLTEFFCIETHLMYVRQAYFIQSNPYFQMFLYLLAWVNLAIGFFEAPDLHSKEYYDENKTEMAIVFAIKTFVNFFFILEMCLDICHRAYNKDVFKEKCTRNKKLMCKIVLNIILALDCAFFYHLSVGKAWRITRCLRPCK